MKKRILSLAFAAAGLFALTSFAATPETATTTCSKESTSCCMKKDRGNKKEGKGNRQEGRKGDSQKGRHQDPMAAFEGINLTDAQKQSLAQLHSERQAARQASRQAAQQNANSDTKAVRPDRRQEQLDYFKAVSVILTPDQYITFLENTAVNQHRPSGKKMINQNGDKQKKGHGDRSSAKSQKISPKMNKQS